MPQPEKRPEIIHSIYQHCNNCQMWGINLPGWHNCGNCNSLDTTEYISREDVTQQITLSLKAYQNELVEWAESQKDYKSGKPWKNPDYDCDCGYDYDDCVCEKNQTLDEVISHIKGKSV